jgi:hypothetical protein
VAIKKAVLLAFTDPSGNVKSIGTTLLKRLVSSPR